MQRTPQSVAGDTSAKRKATSRLGRPFTPIKNQPTASTNISLPTLT